MKAPIHCLLASLLLFSGACTKNIRTFENKEGQCAIEIDVEGIRGGGYINALLVDNPEDYRAYLEDQAEEKNLPAAMARRKIYEQEAPLTFAGRYCAGRYAVILFHDENSDGQLNKNKYKLPIEGIGFSANGKTFRGLPDWEAAAFDATEETNKIEVRILYP